MTPPPSPPAPSIHALVVQLLGEERALEIALLGGRELLQQQRGAAAVHELVPLGSRQQHGAVAGLQPQLPRGGGLLRRQLLELADELEQGLPLGVGRLQVAGLEQRGHVGDAGPIDLGEPRHLAEPARAVVHPGLAVEQLGDRGDPSGALDAQDVAAQRLGALLEGGEPLLGEHVELRHLLELVHQVRRRGEVAADGDGEALAEAAVVERQRDARQRPVVGHVVADDVAVEPQRLLPLAAVGEDVLAGRVVLGGVEQRHEVQRRLPLPAALVLDELGQEQLLPQAVHEAPADARVDELLVAGEEAGGEPVDEGGALALEVVEELRAREGVLRRLEEGVDLLVRPRDRVAPVDVARREPRDHERGGPGGHGEVAALGVEGARVLGGDGDRERVERAPRRLARRGQDDAGRVRRGDQRVGDRERPGEGLDAPQQLADRDQEARRLEVLGRGTGSEDGREVRLDGLEPGGRRRDGPVGEVDGQRPPLLTQHRRELEEALHLVEVGERDDGGDRPAGGGRQHVELAADRLRVLDEVVRRHRGERGGVQRDDRARRLAAPQRAPQLQERVADAPRRVPQQHRRELVDHRPEALVDLELRVVGVARVELRLLAAPVGEPVDEVALAGAGVAQYHDGGEQRQGAAVVVGEARLELPTDGAQVEGRFGGRSGTQPLGRAALAAPANEEDDHHGDGQADQDDREEDHPEEHALA